VADICIVNTCSVTEVADSKCRQAISRMARRHPGALMVVTGCYAQLRPERVAALSAVDLVIGAEQKGDIPRYVAEALGRRSQATAPAPGGQRPSAHEHITVRTADIRSFVPSCACGERTRYFLRYRTAATTTAPTAPFPSPADAAATAPSRPSWSKPRRQQGKAARKSY
jgi:threonylcarbamoyladenosine tRNA methylthiotransferase MtaB